MTWFCELRGKTKKLQEIKNQFVTGIVYQVSAEQSGVVSTTSGAFVFLSE